ncbi:hypothetical protein CVT24_001787 [Panaeolus cyanescens]|uniref:Eukaryotic mitochondrial regulator protein-domain-containing protein n=1 Tax=Panaeolus cyanescens TaxID=181874 RepID=A0A409YUC5_9AGAR|nr:hypothetical protein CVT24_001787 [Panaeolus cyanescens]
MFAINAKKFPRDRIQKSFKIFHVALIPMLSRHLLSLPCLLKPCVRSTSRPAISKCAARRSISYTSSRAVDTSPASTQQDATKTANQENEDDDNEEMGLEQESEAPDSYRVFMDQIGHNFKEPKPKHWLGGEVVEFVSRLFPWPPPPISDQQKQLMYDLFMADPMKNRVRRLAKQFNISLKRVDAILRLKGLENDWKKGIQVQTGFQSKMDHLLAAQTHTAAVAALSQPLPKNRPNAIYEEGIRNSPDDPENVRFMAPEVLPERSDVQKADMLEQEERRDAARYRYERLYWESTPEDGREPVLPTVLQHVKQQAELKKLQEQANINKKLMPHVPQTAFIRRPRHAEFVVKRNTGPTTKFLDVGARFMDVDERKRRDAIADRKSRIRDKRRSLTA